MNAIERCKLDSSGKLVVSTSSTGHSHASKALNQMMKVLIDKETQMQSHSKTKRKKAKRYESRGSMQSDQMQGPPEFGPILGLPKE